MDIDVQKLNKMKDDKVQELVNYPGELEGNDYIALYDTLSPFQKQMLIQKLGPKA